MTELTNNHYLPPDQLQSLIHLMLDHNIKTSITQAGIAIYPVDEPQSRLIFQLSLSHGMTLTLRR